MAGEKTQAYPVAGPGRLLPPNYDRAVRSLSDAELEDEILVGKGDDGYKAALVAEHARRAAQGPPEPVATGRPFADADEWDDAA